MSRTMSRDRGSPEKGLIDLFAKVTIGDTGAPTLTRGKGITSIARNSTGNYTLTLMDNYQLLLAAQASIILASGSPASPAMHVVADGSASGTVQVEFNDYASPSATELSSGDVVLLHLVLSNSSAS